MIIFKYLLSQRISLKRHDVAKNFLPNKLSNNTRSNSFLFVFQIPIIDYFLQNLYNLVIPFMREALIQISWVPAHPSEMFDRRLRRFLFSCKSSNSSWNFIVQLNKLWRTPNQKTTLSYLLSPHERDQHQIQRLGIVVDIKNMTANFLCNNSFQNSIATMLEALPYVCTKHYLTWKSYYHLKKCRSCLTC